MTGRAVSSKATIAYSVAGVVIFVVGFSMDSDNYSTGSVMFLLAVLLPVVGIVLFGTGVGVLLARRSRKTAA